MNSHKENSLFIDQLFDNDALANYLNQVRIYKTENNQVITKLNNQIICTKSVSNKYGCLDFGNFVTQINPEILKFFKPVTFNLKIYKGTQQLDLLGNELTLNNEIYLKRFTIFSSTNAQNKLMISAGLLRQVCSNGSVVGTGIGINKRVKHYKLVISELYNWLCNELPKLDYAFDMQLTYLAQMDKSLVSYRQFLLGILKGAKKDETKIGIENVKRHSLNLLTSASDSLNLSS